MLFVPFLTVFYRTQSHVFCSFHCFHFASQRCSEWSFLAAHSHAHRKRQPFNYLCDYAGPTPFTAEQPTLTPSKASPSSAFNSLAVMAVDSMLRVVDRAQAGSQRLHGQSDLKGRKSESVTFEA